MRLSRTAWPFGSRIDVIGILAMLVLIFMGARAAQASDPLASVGIEKFIQFRGLKLSWSASGAPKLLSIPSELPASVPSGSKIDKRLVTLKERPPGQPSDAAPVTFKGALVSEFVDLVLLALPLEERSTVDLLVLKSRSGAQMLMPRSAAIRYPVLLASHRSGKTSLDKIPVVFPWSSHPKLAKEPIPFDQFAIDDLVEIEFSNVRFRFNSLFLTRRTDPAAIRGEKIFTQNCLSCHAIGRGPSLDTILKREAPAAHPAVAGAPVLGAKELRALTSYWTAHKLAH